MERILVDSKEILDLLYKEWALTFIGITDTEENINAIFEWIRSYTYLKRSRIYSISGKTMNSFYGLTGDNAYPETLNIYCVRLSDIENANALAMPRFEIYGRWFNDVVDNNARRQEM